MQAFMHQVLSGLAEGGIYASVALALVMIYQATALVNFAQGQMAMFSTYICLTMLNAGAPYVEAGYISSGVLYWGSFLLTLVASFVGGLLLERVFIINSVAGWIWTYTTRPFPSPFSSTAWYGSTYLSPHEVGMIFVTLVVLAAVFAFFRFTPLGLAMRAAAQNPASSRLVGIRVGWMLAIGWGLAAAIGAVAGMMAAPVVFLDPNMMTSILIYGFAAALVGGIDNPWGAVLGGFIVGVLENLAGAYLPSGTQLKLTVALVVIVGVLLVKPSGLFGRVVETRV
jgi:branched-chain amino acid transport system permease protein